MSWCTRPTGAAHGKVFKALAVQLGLADPMTATVANPELMDFINWTLLPRLGRYPHRRQSHE